MLNSLASAIRAKGPGPLLYCGWAVIAIGFAVLVAGLSSETLTRLAVIVFLIVQFAWRRQLIRLFSRLAPRARFVIMGTLLAAVVEGFHMISKPVFLALRIDRATPLRQGLVYYGLDLLYTVPAYLVIFSVIWYFVNRYAYSLWQYILLVGLAQTLGDGGIFYFLGVPPMLFFLPYPMTNYHAINILPFLAARPHLTPARRAGARAYLVVPAVIMTYLVCGSLIKLAGRAWGLE